MTAEELTKAVQRVVEVVSQAIYPRVNALAAQSREIALQFIRRTLRWLGMWLGMTAFLLSILLFIAAEPLGLLLLGEGYAPSIILVHWMAFVPRLAGLSNVLGILTMLTFGLRKQFSRITIIAGVFNVLLVIPMVHFLEAQGATISIFVTEAIITLSMALVLRHRGYLLFGFRKAARED